MKKYFNLCLIFALTACLGYPDSLAPVQNFSLERYLGQWYEIARLDHRFERGLSHVTANYSLNDDGSVRVLNRGYSQDKQEWEQAEGRAQFVNSADEAYLKVSFFGPFYGSYVVFELDQENYDYAFISGPDHSYLWLLSREPQISDERQSQFLNQIEALGFDQDAVIFVEQSNPPAS